MRALVFICMFLCGLSQASESDHVLAAGDEIDIKVYQEDDLSLRVWLDESGIITYPYLGNIKVTGKTIYELKEFITKGLLGGVLVKPSVNISIVKYRNFYIGGGVKKAGGYPYQPGLSVRQAISLAEGLTDWGSASKIQIRREGKTVDEAADYDSPVGPGDTITVKEGLF